MSLADDLANTPTVELRHDDLIIDVRKIEGELRLATVLLRCIADDNGPWSADAMAFLARIDARNGNGHGCELVNCSGVGPHASHSRRAK